MTVMGWTTRNELGLPRCELEGFQAVGSAPQKRAILKEESDIKLVQLDADLTMLARRLGEPAERSTEKRVAPGRLGEDARILQKRDTCR
jgi:hypothetical protein